MPGFDTTASGGRVAHAVNGSTARAEGGQGFQDGSRRESHGAGIIRRTMANNTVVYACRRGECTHNEEPLP